MNSYPFSKLTDEAKEFAKRYINTGMITFVKPLLPDYQRTAIAKFNEIDQMLADGWLVIDNTK